MKLHINPRRSIFESESDIDGILSTNELADKYTEYFSKIGYVPSFDDLVREKGVVEYGSTSLFMDLIAASRAERLYNNAIDFINGGRIPTAKNILSDIIEICPRYTAAIRALVKLGIFS